MAGRATNGKRSPGRKANDSGEIRDEARAVQRPRPRPGLRSPPPVGHDTEARVKWIHSIARRPGRRRQAQACHNPTRRRKNPTPQKALFTVSRCIRAKGQGQMTAHAMSFAAVLRRFAAVPNRRTPQTLVPTEKTATFAAVPCGGLRRFPRLRRKPLILRQCGGLRRMCGERPHTPL